MYPIPLLSNEIEIAPIFGEASHATPHFLDYSLPTFRKVNPRNLKEMDYYNANLLSNSGKKWAFWWYLEDRSYILTGTHIREEGRIYHLGIDILFPAWTPIFSPLDGKIIEKGYESGDGNYGGFLIMQYEIRETTFYALFGHLSVSSINKKQDILSWEEIAILWNEDENGNWFAHLHLQVFTGLEFEKWKSKWYCSRDDIPTIRNYCPDPNFLLRY